MEKSNTMSLTAKNNAVILVVTLIAIMFVGVLTAHSAYTMNTEHRTSRSQEQIIYNKPSPSRLEAAAESVIAPTLAKPPLPINTKQIEIEGTMKSQLTFWLFGLFAVIFTSVLLMFRTLKEDQNMQSVSKLHALARAEH